MFEICHLILYCAHAKLHTPFPFDGLLMLPREPSAAEPSVGKLLGFLVLSNGNYPPQAYRT